MAQRRLRGTAWIAVRLDDKGEEGARRTQEDEEKEARLTAMIPAMTTGMMHFIMRSGRRTPMAAIPTPDLDVPYEAPIPAIGDDEEGKRRVSFSVRL